MSLEDKSGRAINGTGVRWDWDPAGRLTELTNSLGTFTYTYDGASLRLATINFPNGQHSAFAYFPNVKDQLLQQITHFKPDSSQLSRFTYDYNSLHQVTQWTQECAGDQRASVDVRLRCRRSIDQRGRNSRRGDGGVVRLEVRRRRKPHGRSDSWLRSGSPISTR